MIINYSTALEYPIEALEKSSGCTGGNVTIPSWDEDRKMSLTSWVFKQIVYFSREEDLFILKAIH